MRQFFLNFLVIISSVSVSGQNNMYTAISQSGEHTIFVELLEHSGLDELLKNEDYYSVLAPTDEAFLSAFTLAQLDSIKLNKSDYLEKTLQHHILTDTVAADWGDGYYPLYGNLIDFFIDAAGNHIVFDGNSGSPYPTLGSPLFEDFDNGRVLWLTKNILKVSSECIPESFRNNIAYQFLDRAGFLDSLKSSATALTVVLPDDFQLYALLDSLGSNLSAIDSIARRHILKGHFAPQDINDGLIAESWYGDQVLFSVKKDTFYINDVRVKSAEVEKNGVLLTTAEILPTLEIEPKQVNKKWFTEEEEWVYRYFSPFATSGYGIMKVVSDTLIAKQNAKLLQIDRVARDEATGLDYSRVVDLIAYEDDGRVYVLNSEDEFVLNYDMNLTVGDSLVYWGDLGFGEICQDSVVYILDSLSTLELGSDTLRVQHFMVKDYHWDQEYRATAVEKIGSVKYSMNLLAHIQCYFDGEGYFLCSYGNEEEDMKFRDEDCFTVPSDTEEVQLNSSGIYPNPTGGIVYIKDPQPLETLSVYSMDGRLLLTYEASSELDLSEFQSGTYILKRVFGNGDREEVFIQKL